MKNYKEKKWLEREYKTKTTYQIAESEKVDPETIRKWMIRFGIERREANNINHLNMSEDLADFMTGTMLGDGSISWGCEEVSAYYAISSAHREYLVYVMKKLSNLGMELRGSIDLVQKGKYRYWQMHSRYYRGALPEFRQIWYQSGKKLLPRDVELTSESLKTFYLEDGSLTITAGHRALCLAMNGFTECEANIIKNKLTSFLGSDRVFVHCYNQGPTIWIFSKPVVKKFFDLIGPCPKELENVFGYKWV